MSCSKTKYLYICSVNYKNIIIMTTTEKTYLLLSNHSDSIVRRCKASSREEAIEIFNEMGYYQEDYRVKALENNNNTKDITPYRNIGISDDCVHSSNH